MKTKSLNSLAAIVLLASAVLAFYVGVWIILAIKTNYPMEYRENAILLTSDLIARGENPYAVKFRPVFVNGFGIGYHWVAYPFVYAFGNSFLVLRVLSVVFVAAGCLLLVWALRFDKVCWKFSFAAALILFSQLGQGLSIVARPDSLGLFLLFASLVIPYRFRFNTASLAFGAVASILGFLTKPYFLIGMPLLFSYLVLFEGKLRGVVFGIVSLILLVLASLVINELYECYFVDTFFGVLGNATRSWMHLFRNGGRFILDNVGFIVIVASGWASHFALLRQRRRLAPAVDCGSFRGPLLKVKMSFPVFILTGHAIILIFLLGLHTGNDILYYHQLISPFLLWIAFRSADVHYQGCWPVAVLLLMNIVWFGIFAAPPPEDHSDSWKEIETLVEKHTNVLTAPHLSHLLLRKGLPIYDNGHTEGVLRPMRGEFLRIHREYQLRTKTLLGDIQSKVQRKEFDAIIVSRNWSPLLPISELHKHYIRIAPVLAPMTFDYWVRPYPLELWVPQQTATH